LGSFNGRITFQVILGGKPCTKPKRCASLVLTKKNWFGKFLWQDYFSSDPRRETLHKTNTLCVFSINEKELVWEVLMAGLLFK